MLRRDGVGGGVHHQDQSQTLDQRFEEILIKLKPYLLNQPISKNSRLCRLWLERLNRAHEQRNLRNDYLFELYKQLKSGCLKGPFNEPPESGRLIPIANCHRLVTSSSCNELTETSLSLCEQKRNWPKPRSKSLRRDNNNGRRNSKIPTGQFDVHSSSPNRSSRVDNSVAHSPNGYFCEPDSRNLLRTYKERIEALNSIVRELENQNEKLKQKLVYYHNAPVAEEIPHLHARIKQLMTEIASLKSKLTEVQEIKTVLEKNHKEIVDQYKLKMTEQFNKMKCQLENARVENQGLNKKVALIEQKLQELSRENETAESSGKEWEQKLENIKGEYEKILHEKEVEIKRKDCMMQQKEMELAQKLNEINSLSERIKELQRFADAKSPNTGHVRLVDQYESIKKELMMIKSTESAARKRTESQQQEILALKKSFKNLEKLTHKLATRERERAIATWQMWFQIKHFNPAENHCEIRGPDVPDKAFKHKYKELLNIVESKANNQLCEYFKKLAFLDKQVCRLKNR